MGVCYVPRAEGAVHCSFVDCRRPVMTELLLLRRQLFSGRRSLAPRFIHPGAFCSCCGSVITLLPFEFFVFFQTLVLVGADDPRESEDCESSASRFCLRGAFARLLCNVSLTVRIEMSAWKILVRRLRVVVRLVGYVT